MLSLTAVNGRMSGAAQTTEFLELQVRRAAEATIVKIGSGSLLEDSGQLKQRVFESISFQVAQIIKSGGQVAIVTSGAVASGRFLLRSLSMDRAAEDSLICGSVGQGLIMTAWQKSLAQYGVVAGQCLATKSDILDGGFILGLRVSKFLSGGIVAIINADDGRGEGGHFEKLRDNDQLASLVAEAVGAKRLILLSNVAGVLRNEKVVPEITSHTDLSFLTGPSRSLLGTGGIHSKIESGLRAARAGVEVVIGAVEEKDVIARIVAGERLGTVLR